MTEIVPVGASCEALGHPSECTEPAPGTVQQTSSHSVTITDSNDTTKQVATAASADLHFDAHSHDHDQSSGCHDDASHDIDPDSAELSSSVTINGSPVYLKGDAVTTDPKTGGDVNITDSGINSSVKQS